MLADETNLSGYKFAHNNTGTLTNSTFKEGNYGFVNETVTITKTRGNYVCGQYWFNDTAEYQSN